MSARTTALIVEREIREAARRRALWLFVGLIVLGSTAMVVVPSLIDDGPDDATVALVGADVDGVEQALAEATDREYTVIHLPDDEAASAALSDGDADAAVLLERPPVILAERLGAELVTTLQQFVASHLVGVRLRELGVDPDVVGQAFADATPELGPVDAEREGREAAAFGITLVLYILTVVLTSQVANGIAVEKSSRVSEVLLAIVPPRSMLIGKVLGVGAIGLVTILAGALPVAVRALTGGGLPESLGRTMLASSLWFLGGLALYLTLAGMLGALVSRQEEVGAVVTPLTMLLVLGYLLSLLSGDSWVGTVLAYVPLFSPMVEPRRITVGLGSPVEYVISLALLLVSVAIAGRLASTVFRRAIVRTGHRLKLRDVLTTQR